MRLRVTTNLISRMSVALTGFLSTLQGRLLNGALSKFRQYTSLGTR